MVLNKRFIALLVSLRQLSIILCMHKTTDLNVTFISKTYQVFNRVFILVLCDFLSTYYNNWLF